MPLILTMQEWLQQACLEIPSRFDNEGIDFAFPCRTVYPADDGKRQPQLKMLKGEVNTVVIFRAPLTVGVTKCYLTGLNTTNGNEAQREVLMKVKQIIFVSILAVIALFILQNTQIVEVKLLFWKVSAVRAVILAATFLLGLIAGFLLKLLWRKKPSSQS